MLTLMDLQYLFESGAQTIVLNSAAIDVTANAQYVMQSPTVNATALNIDIQSGNAGNIAYTVSGTGTSASGNTPISLNASGELTFGGIFSAGGAKGTIGSNNLFSKLKLTNRVIK